MRTKGRAFLVSITAVLLVLLPLATVNAYDSGPKWIASQNGSVQFALFTRQYQVDPSLDQLLGFSPSPGTNLVSIVPIRDAVGLWNKVSTFQLVEGGGWNPSYAATFSAQDLQSFPCGGIIPTDFAVTCVDASGSSLVSTRVYFNTRSGYVWNTVGLWEPNSSPKRLDLFTVALHEFGHMYHLRDLPFGHDEAVMWNSFPYPAKRILQEDDKHGASMLYGPNTGFEWEQGWARGQENYLVYAENTAGWYSNPGNPHFSPPQEFGAVGAEGGVSPGYWRADTSNNARMGRLAGYALANANNHSYAYHAIFTANEDKAGGDNSAPRYWLRIQPGMVLSWCQLNVAQRRMGVDLHFTDDTFLRSYGDLIDQFGLPAHPAFRDADPKGPRQWFCPEITFPPGHPVIGKQIKHVMIAYDSGINNPGAMNQNYRAYFDEIQIRPALTSQVQASTTGSGGLNVSWQGTTATYTPVPGSNSTFIGWTYDGAPAGWATPLTVSQAASHTLQPIYAQTPAFGDIVTSSYQSAIIQLAARGIISGTGTNTFSPTQTVLRAQVAAFMCRSLDWVREDWGNPFPDQNGLNADLWRNVGALNHYGAAKGYANGNFGPNDPVSFAQSISFISRSMVAKGYWRQQPDNPSYYPNVPASTGHRSDLATYVYYAGTIPGTGTPTANWVTWSNGAPRDWFAQALWQALNSRFSVDNVP